MPVVKVHKTKVHGAFVPYEIKVSYNRPIPDKKSRGGAWMDYLEKIMKTMKIGGSIELKKKDANRARVVIVRLKKQDLSFVYRLVTHEVPKKDCVLVFRTA